MFKVFFGKYIYIILTITCSTYSQLVLRWQMQKVIVMPSSFILKILFLLRLILTNGFVFSAFCASLISALSWLLALRALPLGLIFPLLSLTYVTIGIGSYVFLKEPFKAMQIAGILLILTGSYLVHIGGEHVSSTL